VQISKPIYLRNRAEFSTDMRVLIEAASRLTAIKKSGKLPPDCPAAIRRMLLTKFSAWKYEDEVRVFIELKDEQKRGPHCFAELNDKFQPTSLILGPRCRTTDREITGAISGYPAPINVVRTVLASHSFQVIRAT
jgi:hypothetical protein